MDHPGSIPTGPGRVIASRAIALLLAVCSLGAGAEALAPSRATGQVPDVPSDRSDGSESWRLTEKPILSLGAALGPEHEVFGDVAGAVRLSSGVIVVADRPSGELRFFDPEGRLLRRRGDRGEGPREFINIIAMDRCRGDSLVVLDARRRYLPVWSPDGTFARTLDLTGLPSDGFEPPSPERFACNDRGALVLVGHDLPSPSSLEEGPLRRDLPVVLMRADGSARKLGDFRGDERYVHPRPGGRSGSVGPRPFGKRLAVALGDSLAYVGTGDAFEIAVFSLEGERVGTVADTASRVELTPETVDAYLDAAARRAGDPGERRELREYYTGFEHPDRAPAHRDLLVGEEGHLWVEEYPRPGEPPRWRVYTPSGERVAVVTLPRRFDLTAAGTDHVLGVWTDELDVEHVRLYGVLRGR